MRVKVIMLVGLFFLIISTSLSTKPLDLLGRCMWDTNNDWWYCLGAVDKLVHDKQPPDILLLDNEIKVSDNVAKYIYCYASISSLGFGKWYRVRNGNKLEFNEILRDLKNEREVNSGNYQLHVLCEDYTGSGRTINIPIFVDTDVPSVNQVFVDDTELSNGIRYIVGHSNKKEIKVTVTAQDNYKLDSCKIKMYCHCHKVNGNVICEYSKDSGWKEINKKEGTISYTFDLSSSYDRIRGYGCDIFVECKDKAGNLYRSNDPNYGGINYYDNGFKGYGIAPDFDEPTISIEQGSVASGEKLTFTYDDEPFGKNNVVECKYKIANDKPSYDEMEEVDNINNGRGEITLEGDGEETVWVACKDKAGNIGYVSKEVDVISDTVPPEVTILQPEDNDWLNDDFTLKFESSEDGSCKVYLNDNEIANVDVNAEEEKDVDISNLEEGENEIKVVCVDNAGNEGESEVVINYDDILPEIKEIKINGNDYSSGMEISSNNIEISFKVTDNLANTLSYQVDCLNKNGNVNNNSAVAVSSTLSNGNYNCKIKVTDLAGNSKEEEISFVVNYVAPSPPSPSPSHHYVTPSNNEEENSSEEENESKVEFLSVPSKIEMEKGEGRIFEITLKGKGNVSVSGENVKVLSDREINGVRHVVIRVDGVKVGNYKIYVKSGELEKVIEVNVKENKEEIYLNGIKKSIKEKSKDIIEKLFNLSNEGVNVKEIYEKYKKVEDLVSGGKYEEALAELNKIEEEIEKVEKENKEKITGAFINPANIAIAIVVSLVIVVGLLIHRHKSNKKILQEDVTELKKEIVK